MKWLLTLLVSGIYPIAGANVIGSDAQNFAPTPDGIDYITVHAAETLEKGHVNFGIFLNYAQNTFPAFEGSGSAPSQSLLDKNDSLTSADINIAYGVSKNFQVGLSLPHILSQSIESSENLGRFEGSGTAEIRPSLKYKFYEKGQWGFATVASVNFNRIESNPYLGEDSGPTTNLELVADRAWRKWNFALNVGHRWRDPGESYPLTGIDPLPNQWIYSTAASYLLSKLDTKLIFEIYGSSPTEKTVNLSNRQISSLESLLGIKYDRTQRLAIHGGIGGELQSGTSTPDWRVYTGLNYAFGPKPKSFVEKTLEVSGPDGREVTRLVSLSLPGLEFEFNSASLTEASQGRVKEVVDRISEISNFTKIRVEGHTDSIGEEAYNQKLSQERALTVKNLMIEKGKIDPKKIESQGFGETAPIADNGNYQGRQANRRVDIIVEQEKVTRVSE